MNRRQLIKGAALGASGAALGVFSWQRWLESRAGGASAIKSRVLSTQAQLILMALMPALVPAAKELSLQRRALSNIDQALSRLPKRTQDELNQLFSALDNTLGRTLLAGVWRPWPEAEGKQLTDFLNDWREHAISQLQDAYRGLHQLIVGAIYAEVDLWPAMAYSGPPTVGKAYPLQLRP